MIPITITRYAMTAPLLIRMIFPECSLVCSASSTYFGKAQSSSIGYNRQGTSGHCCSGNDGI